MKPRISMITLGVDNLAAAIAFYEQGLGFPRMESPSEVAFFTLNGTWLSLYGRETLAEDAQVSAEGKGFEGFALAHNVGSEKEVEWNPEKGGIKVFPPGELKGEYAWVFKIEM